MCIFVPHHSPPLRRTRPRVRLEILNHSMPTNQILGVNQQPRMALKFKFFQARTPNNAYLQIVDKIY